MSKNETNRITTLGALASRPRSTQKVLDIERRFIDDPIKECSCTLEAKLVGSSESLEEYMQTDELVDELRPEYDLSTQRVRKLGPGRKSFGDVIRLDPDVASAFPNSDAVNEALRFLIRVTKENQNHLHFHNRDV